MAFALSLRALGASAMIAVLIRVGRASSYMGAQKDFLWNWKAPTGRWAHLVRTYCGEVYG